jgi:hypothetical protein
MCEQADQTKNGGEDRGRHWHLCKFCGEAVCESCGVTHYCEKQRSMKPNNLRWASSRYNLLRRDDFFVNSTRKVGREGYA